MSKIIILTHLFLTLLHTNCINRIDYPYEYVLDKDKGNDDISNYLVPRKIDHTITEAVSDETKLEVEPGEEDTESSVELVPTKSTKKWPYSRKIGWNLVDLPPGLRTDVVFRLQEQLSRATLAATAEDDNYKYMEDPWPWPVISFETRISPLTLPTPPSRISRTFRDHFLTVKYNLLNRYTFATTKYTPTSELTITTTRDIAPLHTFMWNHFLPTTSLPWYLGFKTRVKTNAIFFPGIRTYSTKNTSISRTPSPKLRIKMFSWPSRSTRLPTSTLEVIRLLPTRVIPPYVIIDDVHKLEQGALQGQGGETTRKPEAATVATKTDDATTVTTTTATTTTVTTTTVTTTTRMKRAYPYPEWICYECGRNETKFGSPFCYNAFKKQSNIRHRLHYRCNGVSAARYQCFKRFLDIGHYNERGCRNFPPRRSGKTLVSKRLRALENMLYDTADGCTFSPHAALVPFSRTIQLYARFHVCVCNGTLCNNTTLVSGRPWLIISLAMILSIKML